MPLTTKHTASVIFGASMLLAGCGGQQGYSNSLAPTTPMQALSQPMDDRRQCQNDGGGGDVRVSPCHIRFDANNPGPKDVIVTADRDGDRDRDRGHAIKESDDCAAGNIATITKNSNRLYTVTPGSAMGSCTAIFRERHDNHGGPGPGDGGGRGRGNDDGVLRIVNNL